MLLCNFFAHKFQNRRFKPGVVTIACSTRMARYAAGVSAF